jgi:hypothetical protein
MLRIVPGPTPPFWSFTDGLGTEPSPHDVCGQMLSTTHDRSFPRFTPNFRISPRLFILHSNIFFSPADTLLFRLSYMAGSFLTLPETSEHKELILSLLESLQHVDWRNLDLKTRGSVRVARALATDESSANVVKTVQMEGRKKATKIKVRNVVIS